MRFDCRVYAYCLMDNHIHIALQVGKVALSKVMQSLSPRYTRWVNWRYQKTGHLFQGRYKAILVEEDAYLHLNPVRAGMPAEAGEYCWSSHLAYMASETIPWLRCDQVLGQLSRETRGTPHISDFGGDMFCRSAGLWLYTI